MNRGIEEFVDAWIEPSVSDDVELAALAKALRASTNHGD